MSRLFGGSAGLAAGFGRGITGCAARFRNAVAVRAAGFADRMPGLGGGVGRRLADRFGGAGRSGSSGQAQNGVFEIGWRRRAWEIEMKTKSSMLFAALVAAALSFAPMLAEARPVGGAGPGYGHGGGGHWNHGGYGGHWNHGGYGGWGGYRGYWGPGYFWGGLGLGIGLGALAYSAPYYGGYDGYYAYPGYVGRPVIAEYVVVDPAPGDRVVRSAGQPVPAASHAPDPIFYPKSGQTPAKTESDRQECNRWATTQAGAMSDASIFQRATYACMEGRGYTVR